MAASGEAQTFPALTIKVVVCDAAVEIDAKRKPEPLAIVHGVLRCGLRHIHRELGQPLLLSLSILAYPAISRAIDLACPRRRGRQAASLASASCTTRRTICDDLSHANGSQGAPLRNRRRPLLQLADKLSAFSLGLGDVLRNR